jgi:threonine dehydratase
MPETSELAAPQLASLPSLAEIRHAAEIVYGFMPATPQYSWPLINARAEAEVWIKHENHAPVGAFKVRGGIVYMDWLEREHPEIATVISATRGNHGQSIAFAAGHVGVHAIIVVPFGNSREKNLAMQALGAELIEFGDDYQAASEHAHKLAEEYHFHRVPSYDPLLVTGVATYSLEFLTECLALDTFYVPIGMGSGIAGAVAVRDALGLATKIVGVTSAHAPATALSFAAHHVVEHASTTAIADGVACRKPDPRALDVFLAGVDRIVEVTDDQVASAMRIYFSDTHNVAEGAGALGLAALLKDRKAGVTAANSRLGTVLCGGNVDSDFFAKVLATGAAGASS